MLQQSIHVFRCAMCDSQALGTHVLSFSFFFVCFGASPRTGRPSFTRSAAREDRWRPGFVQVQCVMYSRAWPCVYVAEIDRFCSEKRRIFRDLVASDTFLAWTSNNRFQTRWDAFIHKVSHYCVGGDDGLVPDYVAKMKSMTEELPIDSLMEAQKNKVK